ncbi:hypothetical protein [Idiomarina seosinensis]|uniref:Uncharacterized protein n=1 Tax=Idiomarina seosinensis TaxID=281739 RepID=A0A432ZJG8_9GAMM|nr:hypothetical protein [Idiomarina seosinensis]RUO78034.1 hypothetical protein CWI81_06085 [Idiomarina seosinensis]
MRLNGLAIQPYDRYPSQQPDRARATDAIDTGRNNETASRAEVVPGAENSRQRAQRWQKLNTFYDEPPQLSRRALEAYQGVQLNERREEVKSMFGVDLYA